MSVKGSMKCPVPPSSNTTLEAKVDDLRFKVEQLLLSPGRSCPMCGTCVQHSTLQETVTSQLSAQTRLLDALEKKVLEMRTALEELALGMEPECVLKGIVQPNWKLSSFTHVIPNFIFYCWTQIFWRMLIIKYLVPLWLPLYFCPFNESQWEPKLVCYQYSSKYTLVFKRKKTSCTSLELCWCLNFLFCLLNM